MRATVLISALILMVSCAFAYTYNMPQSLDYDVYLNKSNTYSFSETEGAREIPFLVFECKKNGDNHLEIKSIIPDSPAEESKLNVGDIILSIDRKKIYNEKILYTLMGNLHIGDVIFLKVKRDNQEKKIPLRVGSIWQ